MGVLLLALSLISSTFARTISEPVFDYMRKDSTLPPQCAEMSVDNFAHLQTVLTVGSKDAKAQGFDIELSLSRKQAAMVGELLKSGGTMREAAFQEEWSKLTRRARNAYVRAKVNGPRLGFQFVNGGEFVEYLAWEYLSHHFPQYYIGGGLRYRSEDHRSSKPSPSLGELDLMIINVQDCSVIGIAEVKMGVGELRKARKQLKTFGGFLLEHRARMQATDTLFQDTFAKLDPNDDRFCAQMLGERN